MMIFGGMKAIIGLLIAPIVYFVWIFKEGFYAFKWLGETVFDKAFPKYDKNGHQR